MSHHGHRAGAQLCAVTPLCYPSLTQRSALTGKSPDQQGVQAGRWRPAGAAFGSIQPSEPLDERHCFRWSWRCGGPGWTRTSGLILIRDGRPTAVLTGLCAGRATPYVLQGWGEPVVPLLRRRFQPRATTRVTTSGPSIPISGDGGPVLQRSTDSSPKFLGSCAGWGHFR